MKEKLIEILADIRPEIDFEEETNYLDEGLLDSLDIASILSAICEEFDLDIGFDELKKENFNSLEAMLDLMSKYMK